MTIKEIIEADIPEIAEVHLNSFPKDHFTSRFKHEMLVKYLRILTELEDYNYIVRDDRNRVAGYLIAGTKYHQAVNKYLKSNYSDVMKVLLFSPSFIVDKMKSFFLKLIGKAGIVSDDISVNIIAVDPDSGNRGIGSVLIDHLERELLKRGINTYILYVRGNNESAITFYMKKSFEIIENQGKSLKLRKVIRKSGITT